MVMGMSLKDCREKNNLSIIDVARKIGVDRRTYYLWESQNKDIPSSMLIKLAMIFKCSINDLLDFHPELYLYEYDFLELQKKVGELDLLVKGLMDKMKQ